MATRKAHKVEDRERTKDIEIEENVDFGAMFLSDHVLGGLRAAGFQRPSPIQLAAIPLGRCGLDLVVQAKSGTGKTCVFAVVALEMISVVAPTTQVLVLAPTREVAVQITQVLVSMSSTIPDLKVASFIGGINLAHDRAKLQLCHIAVGTPGRVAQLVEMGLLKLDNVRLFVLDEADQLLSGQFTEGVVKLASGLPLNKQVLAMSATFTEDVAKVAETLMRSPNHVRLGRECPSLLGVGQFVIQLPYHHHTHRTHKDKFTNLISLLSTITFNQCLVFSNSQLRAESISNQLRGSGWPVSLLMGGQKQHDRLAALDSLCSYRCRVLVSTDLAARGLDSEHVNLVINMDVPQHHATYLHRIGRAGRFGSRGAAITLATEGNEWCSMKAIATLANVHVQILQDEWPATLTQHQLEDAENLEYLSEDELESWVKQNSDPYKDKSRTEDKDEKSKDKKKPRKERIVNGKGSKIVNGIQDTSDDDSDDSGKENREANCLSAKTSKTKVKKKETASKNSKSSTHKTKKKGNVTDASGSTGTVQEETKHENEEKAEDLKKRDEAQKEEDYRKVVKLFQGLNLSPPSITTSYTEILAELSEKYDGISTTDFPFKIPPLPNKLDPSEDDLKALDRYLQTIQEEVKQKTEDKDKAWAGANVDIHTALQALIEGKDPQSLIVRDEKGGAGSSDHNNASKDPSRKDKSTISTSQSSETSSSLESSTPLSKERRQGAVRKKSSKKVSESDQSSQDESDCEQLRKKKSSNRKQSISRGSKKNDQKDLYSEQSREHPRKKESFSSKQRNKRESKKDKKRTSESKPSETQYYGVNGQYNDNQWQQWQGNQNTYWPGWEQYSYPNQQYMYPSYQDQWTGNQSQNYQYQYQDYSGNQNQNYQDYRGTQEQYYQYPTPQQEKDSDHSEVEGDNYYQDNSNYPNYSQGYDYYGNYWSGQQNGYPSQYNNGWGGSYSDPYYQQQQSFMDSACKFASMMDYVQTMGRMSAKIAHDYFSRKDEE